MPTVAAINQAPRQHALDGSHLNWLIARYVEQSRVRLDNQTTVDHYEDELHWWVAWWEREGPSRSWLLRPDDFAVFERYLRSASSPRTAKRLSYHTRDTILKRLKEALRWAHDRGYVERNYAGWLPKADGAPPKRKAAGVLSLRALLEAAGTGRKGDVLRDRTIVAMLMGMGLRRAELSGLNVEEVIVEADHSGYANVVGKRTLANADGRRSAAFDRATGQIIVQYLDACGRTCGPLFLGERGQRLTGQGVYKVVKRAIAAAGLDGQITGPHDLRRAFSTHYLRSRPDSFDLVRRQLGHASYTTTAGYTLLEVDDIRVDLVSPLSLAAAYE